MTYFLKVINKENKEKFINSTYLETSSAFEQSLKYATEFLDYDRAKLFGDFYLNAGLINSYKIVSMQLVEVQKPKEESENSDGEN